MEHRILKGDGSEKWLPFARSCITKLKRLGLPYADQSFEVDGYSIKVRVQPGNEYIRIDGGGCTLAMDSGIVDLISTGENSRVRYKPGILYETGHPSAYNAQFVLTEGSGAWRLKPQGKPKSSVGQISGIVTGSFKELSGKVPIDGKDALSFIPMTEPIPDSDPQAYKYSDEDETLYDKKVVAARVPPSIFTGKCRLYVQSMYGQHMYDTVQRADRALKKTGKYKKTPFIRGDGLHQRPSLMVPAYVSPEEQQALDAENEVARLAAQGAGTEFMPREIQPLRIDTGTGVYLDRATGKHWLINTGYWSVAVYPLISNKCGEALRGLLSNSPPKGAASLSADDLENIEAYILSGCLPQVVAGVVLDFPEITGWAMGYSWHWNWTGDKADIVVQNQWMQEISSGKEWFKMSSEHYRLTLTATQIAATDTEPARTTFSINRSTVEAKKDWAINRIFWCIAEPGWATGGMDKTTPKYTKMFPCDAPFYVFYVRDELKTCRVNVTEEPAKTTVTESYGYRGILMVTLPGRGGFNDTEIYPSSHFIVTFSCAGVSTPPLPVKNSILQYSRVEHLGQTSPEIFNEWGWFDEGIAYRSGDPAGLSNSGWSETVIYSRTHSCGGTIFTTFSRTWGYGNIDYVGLATIIVPFYDAEAVFVHYSNTITRRETGANRKILRTTYFHSVTAAKYNAPPTYPLSGAFVANNWYGLGYGTNEPDVLSFDNPPDTTDVTVDEQKKFVSRAGIVNAVMNDLPPFHDALVETTGTGYGAISGTRVSTPVVISPTRITPIGSPIDKTSDVVLVGWV